MALPEQFGPYWLLERVGAGAQGDVHLARRAVEGAALVVVKRTVIDRLTDGDVIRRFRHEAEVLTSVDSPNVAKVFDAGQVENRLYTVMEYVPGWTLARVIADLQRIGEFPSIASVIEVVSGALDGLHALHTAASAGGARLEVVHRDIAPKNLMVSDEGVAKVIDLGLARTSQRGWKTATGVVMGTPGYIAPEHIEERPVDHRADLYGMGVVLFELLTLQPFVRGRSVIEILMATSAHEFVPPSTIRSDVPHAIDRVVRRAVRLDPNDRFPDAAAFAAALRGAYPRRSGAGARTLMTQMAWQDILDTKLYAEALEVPNVPLDEAEASRPIVYGSRVATRRDPRVVAAPGERSRTARALTVIAGLLTIGAIMALGWLARDSFDRAQNVRTVEPALPTTTAESLVPRVVPSGPPVSPPIGPTSVGTALAEEGVLREKRPTKAVRVVRPKRRTPKVPAPLIAPPPPPSVTAADLVVRARQVWRKARGTSNERRAARLLLEVQSLTTPGVKPTRSLEALAEEVRALESPAGP